MVSGYVYVSKLVLERNIPQGLPKRAEVWLSEAGWWRAGGGGRGKASCSYSFLTNSFVESRS